MNTQIESNPVPRITETRLEAENPMQEHHGIDVTESAEVTAEAVFTARELEVREEAGSTFVP